MPEKPPLPRRRSTAAAGSWVWSLQCKSMAADDVAPRKLHPLIPRAGCGSSGDALSHVAPSKPAGGRPRPKPSPEPGKKTKPKPKLKPASVVVPPSPPPGPLGPVPALTELPAGHSSRQVVEIIFLSSWSSSPVPPPSPPQPGAPTTTTGSGGASFPGVVEMLFRVHNPARAVARFEDYRAAVRARAGGAARSAADGNEMMRFSPAPAYGSSSPSAAATCGGDAPRIRTFDGSGGAHAASGRGPATGRRAMFLCRVIAGRVAEAGPGAGSAEPKEQFDSVRVGKGGGELVVFDRRAVLPCFLIIYRL
ncbi:unnamed protein product [Urochloa humidicola]